MDLTGRGGVTVLAVMIYSICQKETALLLHSRGREYCMRSQKMQQDTTQYLCAEVKVNCKVIMTQSRQDN